jgi:predicted ATP-dependent endonuclease of OLD family
MDIELTLKNYRCFSDEKPARIEIRQGFTAFLGINNSGKSSLLRFFYELRDLFWRLSSTNIVVSSNDWQMTTLVQSLNGTNQGFNFPSEILDTEEVFCNANNRDMLMQIRFTSTGRTGTVPIRLDVLIQRSTRTWTCKLCDIHS